MNNKLYTEASPWTKDSSSIVYENPWFKVKKDVVKDIHDNTAQLNSLMIYPIVAVVPVDKEGSIHLVGQYKYATNKFSWELPMGGMNSNEDPLMASKREMQEELGITAKLWTPLLENIQGAAGYSNEVFHSYVAEDLTFGCHSPDKTEHLYKTSITLSESISAIQKGEITELRTIACLYAYKSRFSV